MSLHSAAVAYSNAHFGSGSEPYYLDNVYCSGSETSLLSCQRGYSEIGVHNCAPGNEAGVKCVAGECMVPIYSSPCCCKCCLRYLRKTF